MSKYTTKVIEFDEELEIDFYSNLSEETLYNIPWGGKWFIEYGSNLNSFYITFIPKNNEAKEILNNSNNSNQMFMKTVLSGTELAYILKRLNLGSEDQISSCKSGKFI